MADLPDARSDDPGKAQGDDLGVPRAAGAEGIWLSRSFFRETLEVLGIHLAFDGENVWYYLPRPVRPALLREMRRRRRELIGDLRWHARRAGEPDHSGEPPFCCPKCDGLHFVRRRGSQDPWSCARCLPPDLPIGELEWRLSAGSGGSRV